MAKGSFICQDDYEIESTSTNVTDVICKGNEITPTWRLLDGSEVLKCRAKCTPNNDTCSEGFTCHDEYNQCIPYTCPNYLNRNHGSLKKLVIDDSNNRSDTVVGSLQQFVCEKGYVINPSMISGYLSHQATVECVQDSRDSNGSPEWKLINGKDVPQCIPGSVFACS